MHNFACDVSGRSGDRCSVLRGVLCKGLAGGFAAEVALGSHEFRVTVKTMKGQQLPDEARYILLTGKADRHNSSRPNRDLRRK
jgi:hypothetical protein